MANTTSSTFLIVLLKNIAPRKVPAKRHPIKGRIPEHAFSTPTRLVGRMSVLPSCSNAKPPISKTKKTTVTTLLSRNKLRAFSMAETSGAEIIQMKQGNHRPTIGCKKIVRKSPKTGNVSIKQAHVKGRSRKNRLFIERKPYKACLT